MTHWKKRISIAFGIFSAIMLVAFLGFLFINRSFVSEAMDIGFADSLISVITFSFLGILLSYRRPENVISWLIVVVALMRQTSWIHIVAEILLVRGIQPTFGLLFWGNLWYWLSALTYTLFAFVIILFPTGRLPSPRWRPAAWLLGLQTALTAGLILFLSYDLYQFFSGIEGNQVTIPLTPLVTSGPLARTLHIRPISELTYFIVVLALIALTMVLLGLWSQISQYRHGDSVIRQQIKWVIYAVVLWALALILIIIIPGDVSQVVLIFVSLLLPIAIAIPILRYRLYDIDLIIRRTLVYGALTVLLAIIYFASVTLLQSLVSTISGQESPLIIVISTLVIAALFAPLRRRVQGFIDRRFYRRKYNAEVILARFATTAQEEVDLNQLTAELLRVVEKTLQPEHVSIWLKDAEA
jgi:hypothetical protein